MNFEVPHQTIEIRFTRVGCADGHLPYPGKVRGTAGCGIRNDDAVEVHCCGATTFHICEVMPRVCCDSASGRSKLFGRTTKRHEHLIGLDPDFESIEGTGYVCIVANDQ